MIRLCANENPYGAPPGVARALASAGGELALYPDGPSSALKTRLAEVLGTGPENVLAGSGSDEILRLACEAFLAPGKTAACSRYSFYRFRQLAGLRGAALSLAAQPAFRHDPDSLLRAARGASLLYIDNPNNPSGTFLDFEALEAVLRNVPADVPVLLDEAYYEYARLEPGYPESLPERIGRHPNLLVCRTFSKAYGLAGLRVGYCAGAPGLIARLERLRPTFNVSVAAQKAASAALESADWVRRTAGLLVAERKRLARELDAAGFAVAPSAGNFLLLHAPAAARDALREAGILAASLEPYGLPDCIRLGVGLPEDNDAVLAALAETAAAKAG